MAVPVQDDLRRERRQRVLKRASILKGIQNSEISCVIRNMHSGGAELRVAIDVQIPSEFLLYVPVDSVAYRAQLRWRSGERVGVMFLGTEPKPRWHYG
jgi:hypothetical protein